jgi:thioredoxin reductase (NADPH)
MTSRSLGRDLPAFRRRFTQRLKVFPSSSWIRAPSAGKPARAHESRTILDFPTGISGQALTARACVQAQKFGAEIMLPATVKTLDCSRANGALAVEVEGDERIHARAVVVASGARYRRPAIPDIDRFEGRGV